jgi:hypothetical protein
MGAASAEYVCEAARSRVGNSAGCAGWQYDRVDDIDALAVLCRTGSRNVGIRARPCECRGLLICEAAPFTGGVAQVILGKRNRGNSVTDLVFAMAVFCCDGDVDCEVGVQGRGTEALAIKTSGSGEKAF